MTTIPTQRNPREGDSVEVILARIETKLDNVINQGNDHESRIRVLEKLVWRASGAAAVIGTIGGLLAGKIG